MSFILFLLTILLYQTKFTSKILGFEIGYAPLLLGPMVLFYGINLILTTNLNISSHYKLISISRILKTTFTLGLSVLFIFGKPDYNSLLISELVGLTASFFFLVRNANIKLWNDELQVSQLRTFARKFKKFPIYNIPSDFMNISSAQFPPFFINVYFGSVVTGHFSLMKRVIDAPVSLLSSSVLEIFRQEASLEYSENGSCRKVFISTSKKLLFISLVPFSLLFFFSPILFTSYLGEGWAEAGYYAQIFSVYYFFKFISSPLSYVFFIAEKQQIDFLLQVYMFLSSLVILNLPNYFSLDEYFVLQTYSTNFVFIYIVYYFISYKYSKNKK
jgi:O-antigen/teichoic acid export membrane protein